MGKLTGGVVPESDPERIAEDLDLLVSVPASSIPSDDIKKRRRMVDANISRLYADIRKLATYRNTLIPVSRLPEEVFVKIFKLLMPYAQFRPDEPPVWEASAHWVSYACVCTAWRTIALSNSSLWNSLFLGHTRTLQFANMHSRSGKSVFLDLTIDRVGLDSVGRENMGLVLPLVQSSLFRLRTLHVYSSGRFMDGVAYPLRGTLNRMLDLRILDDERRDYSDFPSNYGLFMPNLRTMTLVNVNSAWSRMSGPNLTHLILLNVRPHLEVEEVLRLLSEKKSLQYVWLSQIGGPPPPPASDGTLSQEPFEDDSIQLPELRLIELDDHPYFMHELLRCLAYPAQCSLVLDLDFSWNEWDDDPNDAAAEIAFGYALIPLVTQALKRLAGGYYLYYYSVKASSATDQDPAAIEVSVKSGIHFRSSFKVNIRLPDGQSADLVLDPLLGVWSDLGSMYARYHDNDNMKENYWEKALQHWLRTCSTEMLRDIQSTRLQMQNRFTIQFQLPDTQFPLFDMSAGAHSFDDGIEHLLLTATENKIKFGTRLLSIDSYRQLTGDEWAGMFAIFDQVEELHLYGRCAEKAISRLGRQGIGEAGKSYPLPMLDRICLFHVDLSEEHLFRSLVQTITARSISHLSLVSCYNAPQALYASIGADVVNEVTPSHSPVPDQVYERYYPNSNSYVNDD